MSRSRLSLHSGALLVGRAFIEKVCWLGGELSAGKQGQNAGASARHCRTTMNLDDSGSGDGLLFFIISSFPSFFENCLKHLVEK